MTNLQAEVKKTLDVLTQGGVILYPTDTIWGIGCDATNAKAIEKIYSIKNRSAEKNFIVLLDNASRLASYVDEIPETAWSLIEFATKPLTIIYEKAKNLPKELLSKDGSIAIRIVNDEFCQMLIARLKKPLVSTSANISEQASPASYSDISDEVRNKVDYIVDWKRDELSKNKPSTIISLKTNGQIKIIRP